jgi:hypothetical protein
LYIYQIPYLKDDYVQSCNVVLENEVKLEDLLRKFLENIDYGYIDDDFSECDLKSLLKILVEELKVTTLNVIQTNQNEKPKLESFFIKQYYEQVSYFDDCLEYIKNESEMILSSEIKYDRPIERDFVQFLINGVETFLFEYFLEKERDLEEGFFDNAIHNQIQIKKALSSKSEIIELFKNWAKINELDISGKIVRMAEEEDYKKRPFLEKLEDLANQVEDEKYYIPGDLMFFSKKDIPPFEELIEKLKEEDDATIACVIDEFKTESILKILNELDPAVKRKVMNHFPCIPTLTFLERKRFTDIFHYDKAYIQTRLEKLKNRFGDIEELKSKNTLKDSEKDALNEYLVWMEYLKKQ